MKKQTVIIVILVVIFAVAIVVASIFLTNKSNQAGNQSNHLTEHHQAQSASEDKFNSLIGREAPNFTLESYDGKKISLAEQKGKKVVLFFTEGVMCYPSCWNQIAAFGKDEAFKKEDTAVFNIVVDMKNEWERAIQKMPELASATILHDTNKNVSSDYGVLSLPSSMHKGQFPGHTYLILDRSGVIRYIFDDPQMAVRNAKLKAELEKLN